MSYLYTNPHQTYDPTDHITPQQVRFLFQSTFNWQDLVKSYLRKNGKHLELFYLVAAFNSKVSVSLKLISIKQVCEQHFTSYCSLKI